MHALRAYDARQYYFIRSILNIGGAVARWLVHWTPDQAIQEGLSLARVIVLCSWVGHFALTVPLST